MNRLLVACVGLGLSLGAWAQEQKLELKDEKDKESYTLGYQVANSLKRQGIEVNFEVLVAAMKDGLAGKSPLLTEDEMRAVRLGLQQRVAMNQQKQLKEQGAKNLEAGKAFLAENAKKEGVKTLPSGLQYKVIKEGSGKTPKADDTVKVQYRGTLINGTEFDSSYKRNEPATFPVNGVIAGWTEALQLMKEGGKSQLVVPPDLAYGERGAPPTIPPNSVLVFEVELLSVENPAQPEPAPSEEAPAEPTTPKNP